LMRGPSEIIRGSHKFLNFDSDACVHDGLHKLGDGRTIAPLGFMKN
jgi:hypothetical protein